MLCHCAWAVTLAYTRPTREFHVPMPKEASMSFNLRTLIRRLTQRRGRPSRGYIPMGLTRLLSLLSGRKQRNH